MDGMPPHTFDGHPGPWAGDVSHFPPFLGGLMFLLLLILALTAFALARSGRLGAPPWTRTLGSPEREARSILAQRFARGEIDGDEFMERASVLNWTPGVEPLTAPRKRRTLR